MSRHRIAIYDMDRTITHKGTWTPFLLATARARSPWRLALTPFAALAMAGYAAKLYSRGTLKQITQALLLGRRMTRAEATRAADAFAERVLADGVFRGARDRIEADRAAGYRLVMATASYRFYAAAIADRLGFDDVIGTETASGDDDTILARIAGENCYGPVKLTMVQAWLAWQGIARADADIRFYSDHVSDAPVLAWADAAFVVNPHPPLAALARKRGWPILDWER